MITLLSVRQLSAIDYYCVKISAIKETERLAQAMENIAKKKTPIRGISPVGCNGCVVTKDEGKAPSKNKITCFECDTETTFQSQWKSSDTPSKNKTTTYSTNETLLCTGRANNATGFTGRFTTNIHYGTETTGIDIGRKDRLKTFGIWDGINNRAKDESYIKYDLTKNTTADSKK